MHYLRTAIALLMLIGLPHGNGLSQPRTSLIESATEDIFEGNAENHTGKGGCVGENTTTTSFVRAGRRSFKHEVRNCAERAELAMSRTSMGATHWLGWSLYIPTDYAETSKANIFAQWAAYPVKKTTTFPCGGVGHKLKLKDGWLAYDLQGSRNASGNGGGFCQQYWLAPVDARLKGKWIDFVQHAKWTGNNDGFMNLWMSVDGEPYTLVVGYRGRTWWNDEDRGPYFKMGLYTGDPGWLGRSPAIVYTDEYRLGRSSASCRDVSPNPSSCPTTQ